MTNLVNLVNCRKDFRVDTKVWKRLGQVALVSLVLVCSVALVYLVYHAARVDASKTVQVASSDSCSLQESKPILIIALNGNGAVAMCNKVIARSNGRYFSYYGQPSWQYMVMCAVPIKKVQYTVYDIVPMGVTPSTRYSMTSVCSLLQTHHRLIGEGF
jgi:hypothetical protein